MSRTWQALVNAFDREIAGPTPFTSEYDRRVRRERVERFALVAWKAIAAESSASCAIPDCPESSVLGYCCVAHADDHTEFRKWKSERAES